MLPYNEDKEILEEIVITRNLSERTELLYERIIKKYTTHNHKSLKELLIEAETEEENKISWRKRTLRKRLLSFRQYLYGNYKTSTAKMNFSKVLTIYRHYEIELHKLPPISEKRNSDNYITFKDLPTKEIIKKSLEISKPIHRAIILFQASSGCATVDTLNLRIKDLLVSVEEYYKTDNVYDMIDKLYCRSDIIPCFTLRRRKTGKKYYTFCTSEAFNNICAYLLTRKSLNMNDRVFKITQLHLMQLYRDVNNTLHLGTVGESNYVRFRSHMLRKYHASALYNNGLSINIINELQGKSKSQTDSSYFMEDPANLKQLYVKHMKVLMFNIDGDNVNGKTYDSLIARIEYLESIMNL